MVSHLFFLVSTQGWSPSQDPLLLAIVSGVVNQVFLWLRASFTLAGFQCSRRLARRPGNQQVHRQVCPAEDKDYWLSAAAPRSSKLAVWAVMLWGRLGTAHSVSFTQTKKKPLLFCFVVVIVFPIHWPMHSSVFGNVCESLWLGSGLQNEGGGRNYKT